MLRNLDDLENYAISATDGHIGHLKDFYFDDDAWVIRYFVVETGTWLSSREVLISPISVHKPDWMEQTLPVTISMEQVRNSPSIDTDKPVSRQNEQQYSGYYGYPNYWEGGGMWGNGMYPYGMVPGYAGTGASWENREKDLEKYLRVEKARHRNDDPHLRSVSAVDGYHIHAIEGDIGHVSGFLVDDETWAIRYIVVNTSNWWVGHEVLVAPLWIKSVNWSDKSVTVDLSRESIVTAPAYDSTESWGDDQDLALYKHYGRSGYWGNG
jgi:PRC-barrel domain